MLSVTDEMRESDQLTKIINKYKVESFTVDLEEKVIVKFVCAIVSFWSNCFLISFSQMCLTKMNIKKLLVMVYLYEN